MAVESVKNMVLADLPFLTDAADATKIENYRVQMCWLMQSETGKEDVDVETEGEYSNLENMMFAAMVKFKIAERRVTENMEGNVTDSIAAGAGTKRLKRAKADVAEAEFEGTKASEGQRLQMLTKEWFIACIREICAYSGQLGYSNPLCIRDPEEYFVTPFIKGENFPTDPEEDPYDILGGTTIGGGSV